MKIRLASASQTRAKLLKKANIDFIQESVSFDEDNIKTNDAKSFVYQACLGKYSVNFSHFGIDEFPLLVADSVVCTNNTILRKAKNKDEAKKLLMLQSGKTVSIITCMIYHDKKQKIIDISKTDYEFDIFDKEDLQNYINSNEWQGKAGACMVEGFCKKYIKNTRGRESVAMGLHVELLTLML